MDQDLLSRFLEGTCSEEEMAYVTTYFEEHPSEMEVYLPEKEWLSYLNTINDSSNKSDAEKIYKAIRYSVKRKARRASMFKISSIAAAILISLGLFFLMRKEGAFWSKPAAEASVPSAEKKSIIEKNEYASVKKIILPDKTTVWLDPGSSIEYTSDYHISNRNIFLIGKADFEVSKNKELKFQVFCGNLCTVAVGTKFQVDGKKDIVKVFLYEGKVLVKSMGRKTNERFLSPGEGIAFNSQNAQFDLLSISQTAQADNAKVSKPEPDLENRKTDRSKYTNSDDKIENEGLVRFNNQSLEQVFKKLSDIYNVEIEFPTELANSTNIMISVDTTQSIEVILRNISVLSELTLKKTDSKKYIFTKKS